MLFVEVDLQLHRVVQPAEDVDVVPALLVVTAGGSDADNVRMSLCRSGQVLEDVVERALLALFLRLEGLRIVRHPPSRLPGCWWNTSRQRRSCALRPGAITVLIRSVRSSCRAGRSGFAASSCRAGTSAPVQRCVAAGRPPIAVCVDHARRSADRFNEPLRRPRANRDTALRSGRLVLPAQITTMRPVVVGLEFADVGDQLMAGPAVLPFLTFSPSRRFTCCGRAPTSA